MGVRGLSPRKLISFDPFVNSMMVILVNFVDFVHFFLSFLPIFLRSAFLGGYAAPPAYVPDWTHLNLKTNMTKIIFSTYRGVTQYANYINYSSLDFDVF